MNVKKLVQTGIMIALALVFQIGFASFAQPAVGPLVNMVLFITTIVVGPIAAICVGLITPLAAFLLGIMKLLPLVPIIMIGNALLVVVFYYTSKAFKYGEYIGLGLAALFKFLFLLTAVNHLLPLFLSKVPAPIIAAFGFNQFVTALIGGGLALVIVRSLKMAGIGRKSLNR